ncbi:unnamed protein product [Moneuplotes crassus]|uniref:Uncharacterized protein n=1 Tax=Euplotes crassus TaxID=5936 RepID=A0AAD1XUE9_EUPCR|nr:unnamed protein product [Moneuplotes crassus]
MLAMELENGYSVTMRRKSGCRDLQLIILSMLKIHQRKINLKSEIISDSILLTSSIKTNSLSVLPTFCCNANLALTSKLLNSHLPSHFLCCVSFAQSFKMRSCSGIDIILKVGCYLCPIPHFSQCLKMSTKRNHWAIFGLNF